MNLPKEEPKLPPFEPTEEELQWAQSACQIALAEIPSLTRNGTKNSSGRSDPIDKVLPELVKVYRFFQQNNIIPLKHCSDNCHSYRMKHIVEDWMRHNYDCSRGQYFVANGVFIAVAIALGWKYKVLSRQPNVIFNFSLKK